MYKKYYKFFLLDFQTFPNIFMWKILKQGHCFSIHFLVWMGIGDFYHIRCLSRKMGASVELLLFWGTLRYLSSIFEHRVFNLSTFSTLFEHLWTSDFPIFRRISNKMAAISRNKINAAISLQPVHTKSYSEVTHTLQPILYSIFSQFYLFDVAFGENCCGFISWCHFNVACVEQHVFSIKLFLDIFWYFSSVFWVSIKMYFGFFLGVDLKFEEEFKVFFLEIVSKRISFLNFPIFFFFWNIDNNLYLFWALGAQVKHHLILLNSFEHIFFK